MSLASLTKKVERLEKEGAASDQKDFAELLHHGPDAELRFVMVHQCSPQAAACKDLPKKRQFTANGVRTTIMLERVK